MLRRTDRRKDVQYKRVAKTEGSAHDEEASLTWHH